MDVHYTFYDEKKKNTSFQCSGSGLSNYDLQPKSSLLSLSVNKLLMEHRQSLIYVLSMAAFALQQLNWVGAMEIVWSAKPKILTGFSSSHVWMCKLDNKAERWRIDAFELWCWRILLRVPWTARRSNQSILKEISPEYSLEGLMLKLQYFGHLMWRTDLTHWKRPWCWERLKAGEGKNKGGDGWMASSTRWTWICVSSRSWWWTGSLACCSPWGHKESDMTERLNWLTDCQPFTEKVYSTLH